MHAEIIDSIPTSGTLEEINFSEGINDLLWVRFEDEESSAWVGKFSFGFKCGYGPDKVELLRDEVFFVLAGGQGYFVNAKEKRLLLKVDCDNLEDFRVLPSDRSTILATDGIGIVILGLTIETWKSQRFSADGVKFISIEDGYLKGKFNDLTDEWANFSFDIQKKKLDCESWLEFWQLSPPKTSWLLQLKRRLRKMIGS